MENPNLAPTKIMGVAIDVKRSLLGEFNSAIAVPNLNEDVVVTGDDVDTESSLSSSSDSGTEYEQEPYIGRRTYIIRKYHTRKERIAIRAEADEEDIRVDLLKATAKVIWDADKVPRAAREKVKHDIRVEARKAKAFRRVNKEARKAWKANKHAKREREEEEGESSKKQKIGNSTDEAIDLSE